MLSGGIHIIIYVTLLLVYHAVCQRSGMFQLTLLSVYRQLTL
jgi:hypothetical protein